MPPTDPNVAPNLSFAITPVQVGMEIMLNIQMATNAGLSTALLLNLASSRAFWKGIKDQVAAAEVMIVKPPSPIALA